MSGGVENKSGRASKNSDELTGKVHRNAKDLERLIENLSVDGMMDGVKGGVVGSGLRGGSTLATTMGPGGNATKRDEERRKFTRAMVRAMKDLEELFDRRDQLNNEIAEHKQNIDTAQDIIDDINAGEDIEVNADGTLKNEEYERLRREYEKRTGKKLDPNNTELLLQAMLEQQAYDRNQLATKRDELDKTNQKIVEAEPEVRKLVEAGRTEELKAVVSSMDDAVIKGVISDLDDQQHKTEVREAVGLQAENIARLAIDDQAGSSAAAFKFENMLNDDARPPFDPARPTSAAKAFDEHSGGGPALAGNFNTAADGSEPTGNPPAPEVAAAPDFNPFRAG